jgi:hypothetical protein
MQALAIIITNAMIMKTRSKLFTYRHANKKAHALLAGF